MSSRKTHGMCIRSTEEEENVYEFENKAKTRKEHVFNTLRLCFFRWKLSKTEELAEEYFKKYQQGITQNPQLDEVLNIAGISWDCQKYGLKFPEDGSDGEPHHQRQLSSPRKPVQNQKKPAPKRKRASHQRPPQENRASDVSP